MIESDLALLVGRELFDRPPDYSNRTIRRAREPGRSGVPVETFGSCPKAVPRKRTVPVGGGFLPPKKPCPCRSRDRGLKPVAAQASPVSLRPHPATPLPPPPNPAPPRSGPFRRTTGPPAFPAPQPGAPRFPARFSLPPAAASHRGRPARENTVPGSGPVSLEQAGCCRWETPLLLRPW